MNQDLALVLYLLSLAGVITFVLFFHRDRLFR